MSQETRTDRLLRILKNNSLLSVVFVVSLAIFGLAQFTESVDKVWSFAEKRFGQSENVDIERIKDHKQDKSSLTSVISENRPATTSKTKPQEISTQEEENNSSNRSISTKTLSENQDTEVERTSVLTSEQLEERIIQLTCVSKDNDSRAPYVFAIINNDYDLTKLGTLRFVSSKHCERSKKDRITIGKEEIICASRDGDGRSPWVFFRYARNDFLPLTKQLNSVSYEACLDSINSAAQRKDALVWCAPKDNDGRAPFVVAALSKKTMSVSLSKMSLGSLTECNQAIRKY